MTIKVGILGYGLSGRVFHAPFVQVEPGLSLVAIASSRQAEIHATYPEVTVYPDVDALISEADVDLIIVGTPHHLHVEHATRALKSGRHVLVEKPVAASLAEVRQLMQTADEAGRLLVPFQNRRWDGDFMTLQNLLASGVLGRVHYFESRWPFYYRPFARGVWREQSDHMGGIFMDIGPHLIDQTLVLFGKPQSVYAQLDANRPGMQTDDAFRVQLHYADGLHVLLECDNLNPFVGPRYVLRAYQGAFEKYGLDPQEAGLRAGQPPTSADYGKDDPQQYGRLITRLNNKLNTTATVETLPGDYRLFFRALAEAIHNGGPSPVPMADILTQYEIIEAARRSAANHTLEVL